MGRKGAPELPTIGSAQKEIVPPSFAETNGLGGLVPSIRVVHTMRTVELPKGHDRVAPVRRQTAEEASIIMRGQEIVKKRPPRKRG